MRFKFLPHTADIKFQSFGNSLEKLFENSALALKNIIYKNKITNKKEVKFKVKGKDIENLLYNFLEEFIILFDSKNFLLSKIKKLKIDKKNLKIECVVLGDSSKNYEIEAHIKAITYNDMFVKKLKDKFISQVVVDV